MDKMSYLCGHFVGMVIIQLKHSIPKACSNILKYNFLKHTLYNINN